MRPVSSREHVVERLRERAERLGALKAARGRAQLVGNDVVGETPVERDLTPVPIISLPSRSDGALDELDALPAVARRARVRDVVGRRRQRALLREQCGQADSLVGPSCAAPYLCVPQGFPTKRR